MLTNSLTKTLESLQKLSAVEQQAPANLSAPQLVAVLERLTLALDAPEQLALSGDTDTLVRVSARCFLSSAIRCECHVRCLNRGFSRIKRITRRSRVKLTRIEKPEVWKIDASTLLFMNVSLT